MFCIEIQNIIWFLLIIVVVRQQCLLNANVAASDFRLVSNKNQIYINDTYNVTCVASSAAVLNEQCGNVTYLHFKKAPAKHFLDNSYVINETSITIYGESAESTINNYDCCCNNSGLVSASFRVTAKLRVHNFSCQFNDFGTSHLNCSFKLLEYNHEDLQAIYKLHYHYKDYDCKQKLDLVHCSIAKGSADRFANYTFVVKMEDSNGGQNKTFFRSRAEVLVLRKPFEKCVVTSTTAHSICLQWENNEYDNYINDHIEWDLLVEPNVRYNKSLPTNNKTEKLCVEDLSYAYHNYELKLRRRLSEKNAHWSEYSNYSFTTNAERPKNPPKLWPNGFQLNPKNRKNLTVYWKQLSELDYNGPNFTYKISVYNAKTNKKVNVSIFVDSNLAHINDLDITKNGYRIEVRSQNSNATSKESSHLHIVQIEQPEDKIPRDVHITEDKKTLQWTPPEDERYLNNYTVYWCSTYNDRRNVCITSESLQSFDLADSQCNYSSNLLSNDSYYWAISANYVGTHGSGGMQWMNYTRQVSNYIHLWHSLEGIVALLVLGTTIHLVFKKYRKMANISIVLPLGLETNMNGDKSKETNNINVRGSRNMHLERISAGYTAYADIMPKSTANPSFHRVDYTESEPGVVLRSNITASNYVMQGKLEKHTPNHSEYVQMQAIKSPRDTGPTSNGYIIFNKTQPNLGYTRAPEPKNYVR